jgi:hypothetical protein
MSKKLLSAKELLQAMFTDKSRPTLRTLRNWQKNRTIPSIKIGGRVFFDEPDVREALAKKNTVRAR